MRRSLVALLLVLCGAPVRAEFVPLDADKAFRPSARYVDAKTIEVRYEIAPGYYMYKQKFAFSAEPKRVVLGKPAMPRGEVKQDEIFGRVETYRDRVLIRMSVPTAEEMTINATSQGCADAGLCYPPLTQALRVRP